MTHKRTSLGRRELVESEEVDAPAGVLLVAELLGDDGEILVERGDVVTKQALQVGRLVPAQGGERSRRPPLEPRLVHLVEAAAPRFTALPRARVVLLHG